MTEKADASPTLERVSEVLTPGAAPEPSARVPSSRVPAAAVAAAIAALRIKKKQTHVHLASSERRAEEIGRGLAGLAAGLEVLVLPPWDCLPYDRASPSRDVMGRRLTIVRALSAPSRFPRVLVLSPEALVQKLPPSKVVLANFMTMSTGARLDRADLASYAARTGYVVDDRIDEPGEIAVLGEVIDIFPAAAAQPLRVVVGDGDVISEIRVYDPLTQRSEGVVDQLTIGPASELILADATDGAFQRAPGCEHRMSEIYDALGSIFDLVGDATFSRDASADERLEQVEQQIEEAFEAHRTLAGVDALEPMRPAKTYLLGKALAASIEAWTTLALDLTDIDPVPNFAIARNPGRAFCDLVDSQRNAGQRVVLTGLRQEQRALSKALARGLDLSPNSVADWAAALASPPGSICTLNVDLDAGFIDLAAGVTVIAASDVIGGRVATRRSQGPSQLFADPDLRIGDVVLHEDHGVGVLRDLKIVEVDGEERDTLELEYAGASKLLSPVEDIGRIWRYGAEEAAVTLDKLKGDGWTKRRAEVSRQIDETAARLVEMAKLRDAATCPPLVPPKAAYAKFAARFAYPETPDQTAAIAAVLADLASGRPMDRLVCGDVGFGKTEVALRAAAAVALSGRQVAIAAPTTVLARQHFENFQRRFAGSGLAVAQLSRLVGSAESKAVRQGLADGTTRIVIGTHALAVDGLSFSDLGLVIIDEEQKFGTALKNQLRGLGEGRHLLALTATPIPRTLQSAMVGLQDVSVIASPPARRRPIRTFLAPFDPASVRTALVREKRRGGQSFFVVPRIEDIDHVRARLAELTPELSVSIAHGGLPPEVGDKVMVEFADGKGDVLLATNIIESGLDVPRANTMFIWRPDRFGLSQLHQLRGRVGRGRTQGIAYLLADSLDDMPEATRSRLSTLEAFDRLGSGLAISARDLDLRGGGDIVGEEQAGHMKMIGASLYQRLLERAVRVARGDLDGSQCEPVLKLGATGSIPTAYVPDAVTRINLYARLSRLTAPSDVDEFEEELLDRFGALPPETTSLLTLARLQCLARVAGVREIGAGPKGVAISLAHGASERALKCIQRINKDARLSDARLIVPGARAVADLERIIISVTP